MHIFLDNLALLNSCWVCAIAPKMLENFSSENRRLSFYEYFIQIYIFCTVENVDCFLLTSMAYCGHMHHIMMFKKLCIQMATGAFIARNLCSMIPIGLLFKLPFYGSSHFYCDFLPLY